jgi:ADP-L-glycero-D-manno-heptose 6-epimerase
MFVVTGANGFIGSALVRYLNERGHDDILCVDGADLKQRPGPLKNAKYSAFMSDLQFLDWLKKSNDSKNLTTLFHMGAISSTTETDWEKLKRNNIELSQTLFNYCSEFNVHYIYASSGAVYGAGEMGFDDRSDTAQFHPLNLYGRSKRDFDIWAMQQERPPQYWHGLRFFNVYGPNEYHKNEMSSVVYKAFLQIQETGRLKLFRSHNPKYKDGEQLRDFVYVKDIVRWMYEIHASKKLPNGLYNQGFGTARSWLDLAKNVFTNMGRPMNIDWIDIPAHIREQYQYFTKAEMDHAFQSGLSQPEYSLEMGIHDYLTNYLLTADPYL